MIYVVHQKRSAPSLRNVQYVGRPTALGNPFTHLTKNTKALFIVPTVEDAVNQYQQWLYAAWERNEWNGVEFREIQRLADIYRKEKVLYLSCWCKDELKPRPTDHACHADILRREIKNLANVLDYYESIGYIWNKSK